MRILLVSSSLPHLEVRHASARLVHYLLERLVERHEVTIVARHAPGEERLAEELRARHPRFTSLAADEIYREGRATSLLRAGLSVRRLARVAARVHGQGRFDVCQVESSEAGVFWPRALAARSVLSCHDLLCKPALRRLEAARGSGRIVAWLMWRLKHALEARSLARFAGVFVLSEIDREWAARIYPGRRIEVLQYPGGIGFSGRAHAEVPGRVAFLGTLQRSANTFGLRKFVQEGWPLVLAECPDAELVVAGVGAPPDLVAELAAAPRVRFAGEVDDVEAFYGAASVFVAPIFIGGGIIVKVLDALAAAVPVVTTERGNEGIRAVAGRDLEIADEVPQMAARVSELLRDRERRAALGRAGQSFVRAAFSAERFAATLESTYERIVNSPSRRGR